MQRPQCVHGRPYVLCLLKLVQSSQSSWDQCGIPGSSSLSSLSPLVLDAHEQAVDAEVKAHTETNRMWRWVEGTDVTPEHIAAELPIVVPLTLQNMSIGKELWRNSRCGAVEFDDAAFIQRGGCRFKEDNPLHD